VLFQAALRLPFILKNQARHHNSRASSRAPLPVKGASGHPHSAPHVRTLMMHCTAGYSGGSHVMLGSSSESS